MRSGVPDLDSLPSPPPGRQGWPWTEAPRRLPPRRADGSAWPRISVVTGSHDQGAYLEETLRSVLLQGYPNLEYIVIDGGSSDDSPRIIERYAPWLAYRELQPDRGQAAMLNSGFAHAGGEVLAYLNSDDTYLPGALERAALEVDARRGRHLVLGRCLFVDAAGRGLGNEHPSRAVGHRRLLAVWKGHTVPQPAAFWSRAAWEAGGPFDGGDTPWIDYGWLCRTTRRHRLHAVDQVLATYRLHAESITVRARDAADRQVLGISRRYWGPPWTPGHLALRASLALHRLDRVGRARGLVRLALARHAQGRRLVASALLGGAGLLAPDLVLRLAAERSQDGGWPSLPVAGAGRRARRCAGAGGGAGARCDPAPPWPDRWAGPCLGLQLEAAGGERQVRIEGTAPRAYLGGSLRLRVRVDGCVGGQVRVDGESPFVALLALPAPAARGACRVEIEAAPWFAPHTILGNDDRRRLCWLLGSVELLP